jgi:hypothetical protein
MLGDALLYFGSFTAILVLFASVIAVCWWLFKKGLKALGRTIRSLTDE